MLLITSPCFVCCLEKFQKLYLIKNDFPVAEDISKLNVTKEN